MRKALFILTAAVALWLAPGALASGWCGTGETRTDRPDAVTGAQIHTIVATPSDSPDLFAADANLLADDIASMSAWWTGQDPTRVPRYDMATFPGGTCLDISYIRLSQPASAYQGDSAFRAVATELSTNDGFADQFKDYVVYYDGPSVLEDVCGTGAGEFDEGGYAIVWLNGCPGIGTDAIETHELLHSLGALPAGAPNACTPATDPFGVADSGHPCDSDSDVLYPLADGRPLSQQVLDFNHDDYYAHSGSWDDIQDTIFLRHLNAPQEPLAITFSGLPGLVTSDLPGVSCTTSCTTQWDQGSTVTLAPSPGDNSRFLHWTGACVGADDCSLTLNQATALSAVFGPLKIAVKLSMSGKGAVKCSPACSSHFSAGDPLTLRAVPAQGWKFLSWGGSCKGTRVTCTPTTDFAFAVHANFKKLPPVKKQPKKKH